MAEIAYLRGSAPRPQNGSVEPDRGAPAQHRPKNAELRPREYLTPDEIERLTKAARDGHGRYAHRDATLILVAFRHGMRAAEVADLEWSQVELGRSASLHVRRLKNGKPRYTRSAATRSGPCASCAASFPNSAFMFATERGGPFTSAAVNRLIKRIGARAKLPFPVHAHMLRHACGYALANAGHDTRALQDWLGHRNIQHTVRYTELSPTRFKDFWRE